MHSDEFASVPLVCKSALHVFGSTSGTWPVCMRVPLPAYIVVDLVQMRRRRNPAIFVTLSKALRTGCNSCSHLRGFWGDFKWSDKQPHSQWCNSSCIFTICRPPACISVTTSCRRKSTSRNGCPTFERAWCWLSASQRLCSGLVCSFT